MQIFIRLPRGVTLTEEGERFVSRARVLLADLEALGEDFQFGAGTARRQLRIGATPGTYLSLASTSLAQFAQANPDVDISTSAGLPREIFPRLETGELDVVLSTSAHVERRPELPVEHLAPLQFAYVVRRDHPLTNHKRFTHKDILAYPAIVGATSDWLQHDMAEGLPPIRATYFSDDFTFIFSLINQTDAYFPVVTISASMRELSRNFQTLGVSRPSKKHHLCLAYSKTRAVSPLVKTFASIMKEGLGA